eukprot:2763880-Rhodomonas_salina.1
MAQPQQLSAADRRNRERARRARRREEIEGIALESKRRPGGPDLLRQLPRHLAARLWPSPGVLNGYSVCKWMRNEIMPLVLGLSLNHRKQAARIHTTP